MDVGIGESVTARLPVGLEVGDAAEVGHERRVLDHRADASQLGTTGLDHAVEEARLAWNELRQSIAD